MRRLVARQFLMALILVLPRVTTAQTPSAPVAPSDGITFLPRSSFHLTAEHLSSDDERFVWDTNFGGDLDLVDYGVGRLNFLANYQAILGEQFRPFDPTQGNYVLSGALTARARGVEVAGVFYHQSRHLSDRAKRQPVDWNMIGVRVDTQRQRGELRLRASGDVRGVVQKSFVDYSWEAVANGRIDYGAGRPTAAFAAGALRWLGTDETTDRGVQTGARAEGGVRFAGTGGAIELFLAVERRIDPYPLEFGTDTWLAAGFRLLSR